MSPPAIFYHPKTLVTLRTLLAIVGGYSASAAISLWLASAMTMEPREENVFIRMVFFSAYTVVLIWSFAINQHRKAVIQMIVLNALLWAALASVKGAL